MKPNLGHINFIIRLLDNNPRELIIGRHVYSTQLMKLRMDVSELIEENEKLKRKIRWLEKRK